MSIYPRERLTDALYDSANRGVAMLIAPAGFGKSEAVLDAFGDVAHIVNLPEEDVPIERIARLIVERANPRAVRGLTPLLQRAPTDENRSHLTEWCSARLRDIEAPIVLEDFQRIAGDRAALRFVQTLIESTVPNTRWVLVSRETPELPLGTWLARDYMTLPLSTDDLAFDVAESAGVAAAMDVQIDVTSVEELVNDVGGWPLAMRLSLGSWERTRALPALRIRTRGVLFEFLDTEIWARLTAEEQQLFDAAAHLNELRPRILGAAGFPESRLTLERLHRRLPLLGRGADGTYRLHELFREYLLERQKRDADNYEAMLRRVARALERFGSVEESVAMYERAGAWDAAILLLSRHGVERIESGHRSAIVAALARLPREYLDHPVVTGLRGYHLSLDGATEIAVRELRTALKGELRHTMRGALSLQLASMLIHLGRPAEATPVAQAVMKDPGMEERHRLLAAANLAMAAALEGEREATLDAIGFCAIGMDSSSIETRCVVRHHIAFAYYYLGDRAVAEDYAAEGAQLAQAGGFEAIQARCYSLLQAIAVASHADMALAQRYTEAFARSATACGDRTMQIYALLNLIMIASMTGNDDLFEDSEQKLIAIGGSRGDEFYGAMTREARVVYHAGHGSFSQAILTLTSVNETTSSPASRSLRDAMLALLLVRDRRDEAIQILDRPILVSAEKNVESRRQLAFAYAYHALGLWLVGRGRAARRLRAPDVSMLAPGELAQIRVIETICSTSRPTVTDRKIEQLTEPLLALTMDGCARFLRKILAPAVATAHLTRSELDVLREFHQGGTTAAVADRMGKSSHTVLSHLKSACSKIGCSGRAAAVAYALDMGWIE